MRTSSSVRLISKTEFRISVSLHYKSRPSISGLVTFIATTLFLHPTYSTLSSRNIQQHPTCLCLSSIVIQPHMPSWKITKRSSYSSIMLSVTLFWYSFFFASYAFGHGCMTRPNPRGSLTTKTRYINHEVDSQAPVDYFPHFPAGPRSTKPGSALQHQIKNGKGNWTVFNPFKTSFIWRASVCGDGKQGPYEHLKGGRYYYQAKTVASYKQGHAINVEMALSAHHNGFIVLHLCDVSKCDGNDISESCFVSGNCYPLKRAFVKECEKGDSRRCGPRDRNHPERWYLPCYPHRQDSGAIARYGLNGTMRFLLPRKLVCANCVLHFLWTTANTCNPPDVVKYFDGPDRPYGWGNCKGQANARGGVARSADPCSVKYPEEYMSCADIEIVA